MRREEKREKGDKNGGKREEDKKDKKREEGKTVRICEMKRVRKGEGCVEGEKGEK